MLDALKVVRDPDLNRDIVSLGFIKNLSIEGGRVAFTIELTTPACPVKDQMRDQARAAVMQVPGVSTVDVHMSSWQLTTPDGPLRWGEWTVIASLDGAPNGPRLDLNLPAAAARALGKGDVVCSLRVT